MENLYRRVVVTGMGTIAPVGNDVNTCWESLISGRNGIGNITYFDTSEYKARLAGEVKDFDPRKYMEKAETLRTDRFTQYALAAASQAMEESGLAGNVEPERFSCYFGSGIGGIGTFSREHEKLMVKGPSRVSAYFIPMLIANMAAGAIAIKYNCQGAAIPAVTACASGSNAIGEAVRAIRHGYADAAVTGGSEAPITDCSVAGFINIKALSLAENPDEASLPFDKRRAGFVMGEGAAALILEEYEHAKKRGARILAEVTGYGSTCDAYHITAPRPDALGAARAMKEALSESGYTGDENIYVNAHGTGTPLNDSIETKAIKLSLGEKKAKDSLISSTKSMTGHMLGAAGAFEAIVCIKVLETGLVPPTINLREPDTECDLNYVPEKAVKKDIDLCLSNSLGFGGHNACLAFKRVQ